MKTCKIKQFFFKTEMTSKYQQLSSDVADDDDGVMAQTNAFNYAEARSAKMKKICVAVFALLFAIAALIAVVAVIVSPKSPEKTITLLTSTPYVTYSTHTAEPTIDTKVTATTAATESTDVTATTVKKSTTTTTISSTPTPTPNDNVFNYTRPDPKQFRLPSFVVPTAYRLDLQPNLDTFALYGRVEIDVNVSAVTDEILLHALQINVSSAVLMPSGESANNISYIAGKDGELGFVLFRFASLGDATRSKQRNQFTLKIEYQGELADDMAGFYRSSYYDSQGQRQWLAVTQFESTSARRAFPCFDEPDFKATFEVSIRVDVQRFPTILSNALESQVPRLPIEPIEKNGPNDLEYVKFDRTVRMSTYLVAFFVGNFSYTEAESTCVGNDNSTQARVQIRVYSTWDTIEQNQTIYAAKVARCSLDAYEKYFQIDYPLQKLDLIAIPDFEAGAMENWGLITFRMTALLYDSMHSTAGDKERVAQVIAHEIAHQWFGNLVTMTWWDEIWLNEGFASFMQYYAVGEMYKSGADNETGWLMAESFAVGTHNPSLGLDSLQNSHPIHQEANSPHEIGLMFDGISYSKGASILSQLNHSSIGGEYFRQALTRYLKADAYGNAHENQLWEELAATSGDLRVESFMNLWTNQAGYPVLDIVKSNASSSNQYVAIESRYYSELPTSNGSTSTTLNDTWWIPFNIQSGDDTTQITMFAGERRSREFIVSSDYFLANADRFGFYRVNYAPELRVQIAGQIAQNGIRARNAIATSAAKRSIPPLDFIGMLDDLSAFSASGYANTTIAEAIRLAINVKGTKCYVCWQAALGVLGGVANLLDSARRNTLADNLRQNVTKPLVADLLRTLMNTTDDPNLPFDHELALLREMTMTSAVVLGVDEAVNVASSCWIAVTSHLSCAGLPEGLVPPTYQSAVYVNAAMRLANSFDQLLVRYNQSTFPGERQRLLGALSRVGDTTIRQTILDEALHADGLIRLQDRNGVIFGIASQSIDARDFVWRWVQTNFAELSKATGAIFGGASGLVAGIGGGFATQSDRDQFAQFVSDNAAHGLNGRDVKQAIERIDHNIAWIRRNEASVTEFLTKG